MTDKSKSCGVDILLVGDWNWWYGHWQDQYHGMQNLPPASDVVKEDPNIKFANPDFQKSIEDSGPIELKNTQTLGEHIPDVLAYIEECPKCQETLQLYKTKDVEGRLIFRCKHCFVKLKKSSEGWVENRD